MIDSEKAKRYFNEGVREMLEADKFSHCGDANSALQAREKAISYYDKAIGAAPLNPVFLSAKGVALRALRSIPEAADLFERSIELAPEFAENYYQLSLCFFESLMSQAGAETFSEALALTEAKSAMQQRLQNDLLDVIQVNIFYRDEILKMGHSEHYDDTTAKILEVISYAQALMPGHVEIERIQHRLKADSRKH